MIGDVVKFDFTTSPIEFSLFFEINIKIEWLVYFINLYMMIITV